jgi:hypothetical protein
MDSDGEREWLEEVLTASVPDLRLAWLLKERFAAIYDSPDREAERRLDVWIDRAAQLRFPGPRPVSPEGSAQLWSQHLMPAPVSAPRARRRSPAPRARPGAARSSLSTAGPRPRS